MFVQLFLFFPKGSMPCPLVFPRLSLSFLCFIAKTPAEKTENHGFSLVLPIGFPVLFLKKCSFRRGVEVPFVDIREFTNQLRAFKAPCFWRFLFCWLLVFMFGFFLLVSGFSFFLLFVCVLFFFFFAGWFHTYFLYIFKTSSFDILKRP